MPSTENATYTIATNQYQYTAFDKALIDMIIEYDLYEIEGDPYSVLTQENTIIISDSLANTKMFDFKVGDKVMLATFAYRNGKIDAKKLNAQELLRQQILQFGFEYTEYTIGAVIHNRRFGGCLGGGFGGVGIADYPTVAVIVFQILQGQAIALAGNSQHFITCFGIYEFLESKKMENLQELERKG